MRCREVFWTGPGIAGQQLLELRKIPALLERDDVEELETPRSVACAIARVMSYSSVDGSTGQPTQTIAFLASLMT